MQCEEYDLEASTSSGPPAKAVTAELTELDSALHELGMLSSLTDSRREYLRELSTRRPVLNLVEMNTRFVSSVSIGLRMKSVTTPHLRVKPYCIPTRSRGEERHRTRSENADVNEPSTSSSNSSSSNNNSSSLVAASVIDTVVSVATDDQTPMPITPCTIKKSKSLENVHLEEAKPAPVPEVELVSTCIQKLKMVE